MKIILTLSLFFYTSSFCFSAPEEKYFLLLGSYQSFYKNNGVKKEGPKTHTFATYIKTEKGVIVDQTTVSWLPCNGVVEIKFLPKRWIQQGCNLSLEKTLDDATTRNLRIGFWGPYLIQKELFDMAKQKVSGLRNYDDWLKNPNSPSSYEYSAVDFTEREKDGIAENCHHMVADVVAEKKGLLSTGNAYGFSAAIQILPWYREWLILSSDQSHRNFPEIWQLLEKEILNQKEKRNPGQRFPHYRVEFFSYP
jgi:hypothetical protein